MSLIQDALKRKREEELVRPSVETQAPSNPPAAKQEPAGPVDKSKPTPEKLLLALILLIVVSLISIGVIKFLRSAPSASTKPVASVVKEPDVVVKKPAPVIEPEPEDKWPELKLTGFASAGGQKMVVINGKMLSPGGRIRGVRIIQIGEEQVVVEYQGEQRTLYANDQ